MRQMDKGPDKNKRPTVKEQIQILQKKLRELERQNRELIETNLYGILEIDIYGNITYINTVMCKLLGYSVVDFDIKEIWSLLATDEDRKRLTDYLTRLSRNDEVSGDWDGVYLTESDEEIELRSSWTCRRDEKQHVTGFVAITTHIENRELVYKPIEETPSFDMDQTQSWMAGKEVNYQRIIENARELILIFDMKGKITFINEGGIDVLGYFEEELVDMNITDFIPDDQIETVKKILEKNKKEKKRELILFNTELINRNLKLVPMELSIALLERYGSPSDVMIIGREFSKRPDAG